MVIGGGFRQRTEFLISDCFIDNLKKTVKSAAILMNLKLGWLHEKHAVATWNLGTISAFP
jgi:hypothetical protein